MRGGQASNGWEWEAWEALIILTSTSLSGTGISAPALRGVSQPLALLPCKAA